MISRALIVGVVAALAGMQAQAQDAELTAKLQAKVAELSGSQQAALFLFLDNLGGGGAPAPAAAAEETPESALKASLEEFKAMVANKKLDVDKLFGRMSEDFTHPVVQDKQGALDFIKNALNSGVADGILDQIEISIEDAEYELDGDEVEIYPIDVDTPIGSVTLGLYGKKENGVWRVVEVDGI
jgi:hypothetical protein